MKSLVIEYIQVVPKRNRQRPLAALRNFSLAVLGDIDESEFSLTTENFN